MSSLEGQVFVVTGAAGAIAGAIVDALHAGGARLALVDHDSNRLRERAAVTGGLAIVEDLTTAAGADAMVAQAKARFGRVDGLVHTVGGFAMGRLHEADDATYARMFDANVRTLFCAARAVLPGMLAQDGGFIAGISAAPGFVGLQKDAALYAGAKAAVAAMLRSLDAELVGSGVRVAILYPMGAVDTPANRKDMPDVDPRTWIDPTEIGATIRFAAERSVRGRITELPIYPPR